MRCFVCGKKLNIFSDYTQIIVDGEKKEICTPCNRLREKKEVKQLLKTDKFTVTGGRIAFESNIHSTGICRKIEDILEFEAFPETKKAKGF